MTSIRWQPAIFVTALLIAMPATRVAAQTPAAAQPGAALLSDMVGTWDVEQLMWTGPDADATQLPPALAVRRLPAGGGFVEEVMTPADARGGDAFTRTAHINYNAIDGVFEYYSIDSRVPQQMRYQSDVTPADSRDPLRFQGGTFVAGQWGDQRNIAFSYRVELSAIVDGRQRLSLFLRPLAAGAPPEFKAFQYDYTRRR